MAINEAKFISDYYNFTVEVIKRSVEDTPALQMFRGVISPHDKKFPMELADICAKQLFDNKIRVPQLSNDKGHIQNPTYEQVRDYVSIMGVGTEIRSVRGL